MWAWLLTATAGTVWSGEFPRSLFAQPLAEGVSRSPWVFHGRILANEEAIEYGPDVDRHGMLVTVQVAEVLRGEPPSPTVDVWMGMPDVTLVVGSRVLVFGGPKPVALNTLEEAAGRSTTPTVDVAALSWSDAVYAEFWVQGEWREHWTELSVDCRVHGVMRNAPPGYCDADSFDALIATVRGIAATVPPAAEAPPGPVAEARFTMRRLMDIPLQPVEGPVATWDAALEAAEEAGDHTRHRALHAQRDHLRDRVVASVPMLNLSALAGAVGDLRQAAIQAGALELASELTSHDAALKRRGSDGEVPVEEVRAEACAMVPLVDTCALGPVGCRSADWLFALSRRVCDDPHTVLFAGVNQGSADGAEAWLLPISEPFGRPSPKH